MSEPVSAELQAALAAIEEARVKVQSALDTWNARPPCPDPDPDPEPLPTGPVRTFWLATSYTGSLTDDQLRREAQRRSYVVLNAWDHAVAAKLKGYNPALKVLCYKDVSSTRSYDSNPDDALLPCGVSYFRAEASWFLRAANRAQRLTYAGYSGHYQMNIGNPAYQDRWAANVANMLHRFPVWDGVWLDNLLWKRDTYHEGVYPQGYATDEAFQGAYRAFLQRVGAMLPPTLLVGNLANARLGAGRWESYLQYLNGGFDEWWLVFDDDNALPEGPQGWSTVMNQVTDAEHEGKFAVVQPHFDPATFYGRKMALYSLASFLLAHQPGSASAYGYLPVTDAYGAPLEPFEEMTWDLGRPLGQAQPVPGVAGAWVRHFERADVRVNSRDMTGQITRRS